MALTPKPLATSVSQYVIPEHLRNDQNSNLIKFLEYYWTWMGQEGNPLDFLQNMLEYREFDVNPEMFSQLLSSQTASFIPNNSNHVDKQLITAYIKDFYASKGTLPSYEFVMNALFGEHCTIETNSSKVLRPSYNVADRKAFMSVVSTTAWGQNVIGSTITQTYPTTATARIENCVSESRSGGFVNFLELAPETVVGTFDQAGKVQVLQRDVNRAWYFEEEYFNNPSYNSSTKELTIFTSIEENRKYDGLIVLQVSGNFRAVVSQFVKREVFSNRVKIVLKLTNVTGTLNSNQVYIIPSSIEHTHYNISKLLTGTVTPTIGKIQITNGGAMHEVGESVEYYGGTGTEFSAKIHEVGGGSIDEIRIYANGNGYSVGEPVIVDESESTGTGLSAIVDKIDGHGAIVQPLMEVEGFTIKDGGQGYALNDVVTVPMNKTLARLQVASLSTSKQIYGVNVVSGGRGYSYCKIAAYLTGTFNPPVETVTFTPTIVGGQIKEVSVTPTELSNTAISIAVNGVGATATVNAPVAGLITGVTVVTTGFNYVRPIVKIVGTTSGRGASFVAVLDSYGRVTAVTVASGGSGYLTAPTIEIVEAAGAGAVLTQKNKAFGYVASLTTISAGLTYKVLDAFDVKPTNTSPAMTGDGLTLDVKYKVNSITLDNSGENYRQIAIETTNGVGSGAVIEPMIVDGVVKTISIVSGGTGYTFANVDMQGTGYGFKGIASIVGGSITGIAILDGGIGYSNGDQLVIYGDGNSASASVTIADGVVKQLIVHDGGSGYAYDTTVIYQMGPSYVGAITGSFSPVIVEGKISSITVIDGGSGYVKGSMHLLTENTNNLITQDGFAIQFDSSLDIPFVSSGSNAIIEANIAGRGGLLTANVTNGGEGYFAENEVTPLKLTVVSTVGSGAIMIPVIENGSIVKIDVIHSGSGYASTDTISIAGVGNGASLIPRFVAGKLISVDVENGGSGYRFGTIVHVIGNGYGAEIEPDIDTGITSIDVMDGGHSYVSPTYTLSDPTGSGAVLALSIDGVGRLQAVHVLYGGEKYTNPTLTITDAYGVGASVKVNVKRYIRNFRIKNTGYGYSHAKLLIIGDGEDASGECTLEKNGSISSVKVISGGSGFVRTPTITLKDVSNFGAVTGIKILHGGANYKSFPLISLPTSETKGGVEIAAFGKTVGHVKGIEFESFGALWNEVPKVKFPVHVVVDENSNFIIGETVNIERFPYKPEDFLFDIVTEDKDVIIFEFKDDGFDFLAENGDAICAEEVGDLEQEFDEFPADIGPSGQVYAVDFSRRIVEMMNVTDELTIITESGHSLVTETKLKFADEASNSILVGDTIIGTDSNARATISWKNTASGVALQTGFGFTEKKSVNEVGLLNNPNSKIHNSERIQDFAYVVKSNLSFKDYVNQLTELVHPAGYKMFGDVVSERFIKLPDVKAPSLYGVTSTGGATSMAVNLSIMTDFTSLHDTKNKGLWYYNTTLSRWHTTVGSLFANYSFNNFDINHIEYISNITPIDNECTVVPTWFDEVASVTTGSGSITLNTTDGINIGYRVIGYDSDNNPIFSENKVNMEDGFALLDEDGVTNICTTEEIVIVQSVTDSNHIVASKNSSVTGTVTIVVQNPPELGLN